MIQSNYENYIEEFWSHHDQPGYIISVGMNCDYHDAIEFIKGIFHKVKDNLKVNCIQAISLVSRSYKDIEEEMIDMISPYLNSQGRILGSTIDALGDIQHLVFKYRKKIFSLFKNHEVDYFKMKRLPNYKNIDINSLDQAQDKKLIIYYILNFCQMNSNYEEKIALCKKYINFSDEEIIEAVLDGLTYIVIESNKIEWNLFAKKFRIYLEGDEAYIDTEGLLCNIALFVPDHKDKAIILLQEVESCMLEHYRLAFTGNN